MPSQIAITALAQNRPSSSLMAIRRTQLPPARHGSVAPASNTIHVAFTMHAYKKKVPANKAQERAGFSTGFADHKRGPIDVEFNIVDSTLDQLKTQIGNFAETRFRGCLDLFAKADQEGTIDYFGYILGSRDFGKVNPKKLADDIIYNTFKSAVGNSRGKEIGLLAKMHDPRPPKRNKKDANAQEFARAMHADDPEADPAERRAIALTDLGIDPDRQSICDKLFGLYGNNRDGSREGMTFYHIEKPTLLIKMTPQMFEKWTDDMVAGKPGVSYHSPPEEFEYVSRSGNPPGLPQTSISNDTPAAVLPPQTINTIPRPISPAPKPWPPFEHFLSFADIASDDIQTHKAIEAVGIVGFDEFLFEENGIDVFEKAGMKHAPAARLIRRAPQYRDQLKRARVSNEDLLAANH